MPRGGAVECGGRVGRPRQGPRCAPRDSGVGGGGESSEVVCGLVNGCALGVARATQIAVHQSVRGTLQNYDGTGIGVDGPEKVAGALRSSEETCRGGTRAVVEGRQ